MLVSEVFLLFSQSIPSQNLGFVNPKAALLEVSIGDRDLLIHQSPTILSSNREGGTTGAGKSASFKTAFLSSDFHSRLEDYSAICLMDHIFVKSPCQAQHF